MKAELTIRNLWASLLLRAIDWLFSYRRYQKVEIPQNPKKILISNIAHLGDVVIATSVLPSLQRKYPEAKIGFLLASSSRCVLENHPSISKIHTFDHFYQTRGCKAVLHHIRSKRKALREIKQEGYEMAIDLQPFFPNAIPLLYKLKIPCRIGYASGGFSNLLTHRFAWTNRKQYLGKSHLELLGLSDSGLPYYPMQQKSEYEGWTVVHMGSSRSEKEWEVEKWCALIQKIGCPVVLTGKGAREQAMCDEVARKTGAVNLANRLNWEEFASIVQRARLLISVDSAAVHLAAASSTPSVVLFADINDPAMWAPPHAKCVGI